MPHDTPEDIEITLERSSLEDLAAQVRSVVDIRNRRYGFPPRTYVDCFVGEEAVQKLVDAQIASDAADAVRLGNLLLNAGLMHHVQNAHAFENAYLFYRFAADEDHGEVARKPDGNVVSWADFIAPLTPDQDAPVSLQPSIPERDPDLASFAQDDLDRLGVAPLDAHNAKLLDLTHPKAWVNPVPKATYNLVVVGAGTGGLVSAAGSAGLGARVALVEAHLLGGDCLNVGCVPSKALLRCAKAAAAARRAAEFGVRINGEISVDFGYVMERMRQLRAAIAPNDSVQRFTQDVGVDLFMGHGRFTGRNTLEVNGQTLKFARAVIATGGTAAIPPIPGLAEAPYLTNATLFNLTALPPRLGVIGAGPIGMEMAQAFQRLGSQVTVFARDTQILSKEDRDAAQVVETAMRRDGVVFELGAQLKRVESHNGQPPITVALETEAGERTVEVDALLVAAGRKPAVNGLNLEAAGVDYDARMGIHVDDRLRTSNADIFAVGDVASKYQFTHMADFMARMVIRNALFFGRDRFSNFLIPWATYTDPEIAHVGLYEKDLQARDIAYNTLTREFADVDRAVVDGDTEGFVKIHVKKGSDEMLGATIVGSHAGDMISEITVAMQSGMGLSKLASVIHPYPTAAEAIRQCGDAYNRARLTPTVRSIFDRLMSLRR